MLTSFEDLLYEENTASKHSYFDADSLLPETENNEPHYEFGMLIEAQLDENISSQIDTPESEHQSAFHNKALQSKQIQKKKYMINILLIYLQIPQRIQKLFQKYWAKAQRIHFLQFLSYTSNNESTSSLTISLHIQQLCETKEGHTIAKTFFKNFRWAQSLVQDDLRSYFRLNSDWNN